MPDMTLTIAETLLTAREGLGLSARDVGEAVGCSAGTVRNWEQGNAVPDESVVPALAALLQVPPSSLRPRPEPEIDDAPIGSAPPSEPAQPSRGPGWSDTDNPLVRATDRVVAWWKRRRALARAPVGNPSYLEDDRQVSAYRLRAVLTTAGVIVMLVVLRWAWGQFADAVSTLFDTLRSVL